ALWAAWDCRSLTHLCIVGYHHGAIQYFCYLHEAPHVLQKKVELSVKCSAHLDHEEEGTGSSNRDSFKGLYSKYTNAHLISSGKRIKVAWITHQERL
ncbi:mCG145955, partial [Mus musculus]